MIYNFLIHINAPKGASLTVNNEVFYFVNEQIFMFDGDLVHSATNTDDKDWIFIVLRISKNEFKI